LRKPPIDPLDWREIPLGIDGISLLLVMPRRSSGYRISLLGARITCIPRNITFWILLLLLPTGRLEFVRFSSLSLPFYGFLGSEPSPCNFLIGVGGIDRRLYAAIKFFRYPWPIVVCCLAYLALYFYSRCPANGLTHLRCPDVARRPAQHFSEPLNGFALLGLLLRVARAVELLTRDAFSRDAAAA